MRDWFLHPLSPHWPTATQFTEYVFDFDRFGAPLPESAIKIRVAPIRRFWWARRTRDGGYVWNIRGLAPGLFRLDRIAGAPLVVLSESPHDIDHVERHCGIVGTCPPHGASWSVDYTTAIRRAAPGMVIGLPHNDAPGRQFIERAVADLTAAGVVCKLVELPDLQRGGDIVDFLDRGGNDPGALLEVIKVAPIWTPALAEQRLRRAVAHKLEHRRALDAARARRYRQGRRTPSGSAGGWPIKGR